MNKPKIILLSGTRTVGKDTFFNILQKISNKNDNFCRYAFADKLKGVCSDVCKDLFGKDVSNLTPIEKEIFRPILISVGEVARKIDKDFWVKRLYGGYYGINYCTSTDSIPVITDCRYVSEYEHFKNIYGDKLILVNIKRNGAPEPTDEEKINSPLVEKFADYSIEWDTVGEKNIDELTNTVQQFYNKYFTHE